MRPSFCPAHTSSADVRRGIGHDGLQFVTTTWRAAAPVTGWLDKHVCASAIRMDRGRRGRCARSPTPVAEKSRWVSADAPVAMLRVVFADSRRVAPYVMGLFCRVGSATGQTV